MGGGHTWELDRDIYLARWADNTAEVERLTAELEEVRAVCSHVANPEKPANCYKCGADTVARPGIKKVGTDEQQTSWDDLRRRWEQRANLRRA